MMNTELLLWVAASSVGSAVVVGGGVGWWATRQVNTLRAKLEHSEAARTAAVERSRQARQQVAQLQQELTAAKAEAGAKPAEARPAEPRSAEQRRDLLARKLDEEPTLVMPRRELPASGFADTMPLI